MEYPNHFNSQKSTIHNEFTKNVSHSPDERAQREIFYNIAIKQWILLSFGAISVSINLSRRLNCLVFKISRLKCLVFKNPRLFFFSLQANKNTALVSSYKRMSINVTTQWLCACYVVGFLVIRAEFPSSFSYKSTRYTVRGRGAKRRTSSGWLPVITQRS